jgi:uncharacterized membrane protein (GlpM family)
MLRTVTAFYLISMVLVFLIAFWLALNDAHPTMIFTQAMMAWPVAALLLLIKKKAGELGLR